MVVLAFYTDISLLVWAKCQSENFGKAQQELCGEGELRGDESTGLGTTNCHGNCQAGRNVECDARSRQGEFPGDLDHCEERRADACRRERPDRRSLGLRGAEQHGLGKFQPQGPRRRFVGLPGPTLCRLA